MSKTITLDLNKPVTDEEGKPLSMIEKIHEMDKYKNMSKKEFTDQMNDLTDLQIRKIAPKKTIGILIREILAKHVDTAKDNELAVEVFELIQRLNKKMENMDGKWEIDEHDLKKMIDLLKKNTGNLKPMQLGQALAELNGLQAELTISKKSEDRKQH